MAPNTEDAGDDEDEFLYGFSIDTAGVNSPNSSRTKLRCHETLHQKFFPTYSALLNLCFFRGVVHPKFLHRAPFWHFNFHTSNTVSGGDFSH